MCSWILRRGLLVRSPTYRKAQSLVPLRVSQWSCRSKWLVALHPLSADICEGRDLYCLDLHVLLMRSFEDFEWFGRHHFLASIHAETGCQVSARSRSSAQNQLVDWLPCWHRLQEQGRVTSTVWPRVPNSRVVGNMHLVGWVEALPKPIKIKSSVRWVSLRSTHPTTLQFPANTPHKQFYPRHGRVSLNLP